MVGAHCTETTISLFIFMQMGDRPYRTQRSLGSAPATRLDMVAEKDIAAVVARSAAAIAITACRGRVRKMYVNLELLYYSNKKWAVEEIFGTIKRIQSPHVH